MATHIVEAVQKAAGLPPLEKIDPNDQEAKHHDTGTTVEKVAQAAIPAVLAAFFKFSKTDLGSTTLMSRERNDRWLELLFGDRKKEAVEKVAHYGGTTAEDAEEIMETVAGHASTEIVGHAGAEKASGESIREYMMSQRHDILVHLPAALQIGYMFDDNAIDDRTNKMEGPLSSLMNKIGGTMSKGDEKKYP